MEGGAAAGALARIFGWASGGVVVVAELFLASLRIMGSVESLGQPPAVWVRRWSTVMSVM
jgi:hypothetical protein